MNCIICRLYFNKAVIFLKRIRSQAGYKIADKSIIPKSIIPVL